MPTVGRRLVVPLAAGIADAGMDTADVGFRLLAIVVELGLADHGTQRLHRRLVPASETVERLESTASSLEMAKRTRSESTPTPAPW
jgi:hypothetical protein